MRMSAVPSTAMGASIVPSTCCTPPSKRTSPSPVTREPGAKMVDPSIRRFAPPDSWTTPSESPPGGLPACIVRRPVSTSNSPRFRDRVREDHLAVPAAAADRGAGLVDHDPVAAAADEVLVAADLEEPEVVEVPAVE